MKFSQLYRVVNRFKKNQSGEGSMQMAVMFSALALMMALVGVPVLNKASRDYADNQAYGIDDTVVGSVEKDGEGKKVRRYTIRKSVLDK